MPVADQRIKIAAAELRLGSSESRENNGTVTAFVPRSKSLFVLIGQVSRLILIMLLLVVKRRRPAYE